MSAHGSSGEIVDVAVNFEPKSNDNKPAAKKYTSRDGVSILIPRQQQDTKLLEKIRSLVLTDTPMKFRLQKAQEKSKRKCKGQNLKQQPRKQNAQLSKSRQLEKTVV